MDDLFFFTTDRQFRLQLTVGRILINYFSSSIRALNGMIIKMKDIVITSTVICHL
jgi:hypothetical protein